MSYKRITELFVHAKYIFIICLMNTVTLFAQNKTTVKGLVTDENDEPLIGVSILEKGTTNGTITNLDGLFSISLTNKANPLTCSYIGYTTTEVQYKNENTLIIRLKEDTQNLDEVVVVGYQVMRKSDITGSIASVKAGELNLSTPTVGHSLIGKVSGVQISQVSGAPYAGTKIRVRGTSSVNASSDPLYVIDGYPANSDLFLNPEDIESIEILKDAASAAIYGSRASGGVVLITTKRGKEGKATVQYDFQLGINTLARKVKMLNANQFIELFVDAHNNTYKDLLINSGKTWHNDYIYDDNTTRTQRLGSNQASANIPDDFYDFKNRTIKSAQYDTDWQDELYRNAVNNRHNISVTGGTSTVRYAISGGFQGQDGIMKFTDQKRFNLRANIDVDINSKLTIGTNISDTHINSNEVGEGRFHQSPTMTALVYLPIFKPYNEDGSPSKFEMASMASQYAFQNNIENPIALAQEIKRERTSNRATYNIYAQYKILPELIAKINGATYRYDENYQYYMPTSLTNGTNPPYSPQAIAAANATTMMRQQEDYLGEATLNYNKQIKNFNLSGIAGFSIQRNQNDVLSVNANGFTDDKIQNIIGGGADPSNFSRNSETSKSANSLISGFGRLNAAYLNRYYLTLTLRNDGCSLFGPQNRWAYFPSVSAGWTISNESFYKNALTDNSTLKLRASWGKSGNNGIGNYNYQQVMGKNGVVIGNTITTAMYPGAFRDKSLGWESTSQFNIGFDFTMLNGRLSLITNYYDSYTTNLLFNQSISAISGTTSMLTNMPDSKINNRGFDIQVDANLINQKDFQLKVSGNISLNRNKVLNLGRAGTILSSGAERSYVTHITMENQPIGMFYGYKVAGMVTENDMTLLAEDDKFYNPSTKSFPEGYVLKGPARSLSQTTKLQPGDMYFEDINNDGVIDEKDKQVIGNPHPNFTYAFGIASSYKNIDFNATFNGVQGGNILDGQSYYLFNMEGSGNQYAAVNDRYRNNDQQGNGSVYRAARGGTQSNSTRLSSFYLEDASYFRCTNITLGYTLNNLSPATRNLISKLRIYAAIDNPFTIQKYRGYNPEVDYNNGSSLTPGVDYGKYPLMRAYNIGLQITF